MWRIVFSMTVPAAAFEKLRALLCGTSSGCGCNLLVIITVGTAEQYPHTLRRSNYTMVKLATLLLLSMRSDHCAAEPGLVFARVSDRQ